ncbi:MAG: FecR domain-containing protein [Mucilaginibacter sp.]|uniref:FecR family protein n=1 Tax=Mucilaginibacter sp. TaxID=1882438 RepID=UPI0032656AA7
MTEEQYLSLCEKYLQGNCNAREEALIKSYQNEHGLGEDDLVAGYTIADKERVKQLLYNKLQASLHAQQTRVIGMRRWVYAVAASVLVFLSVGIYIINTRKSTSVIAKVNTPARQKDIQPGTNKAILTLANGKHIQLDDAKNGVLSKQGNSAITKSGNGIVIKNGSGNALADIALNTITIPRGGKYNITLPDGTHVWLNASSSLTFPTVFTGNQRKVAVTGEAYFEVAKNKAMPFKIDVNGKQVVEVLGTHFNINAYADERTITTTLLEGSVKINYQDKSTLIKPGEMAVNTDGSGVTVKPADVDEVMAWKNDQFVFNSENIVSIMKKISRWYDVDVIFKGDMAKINFDGNYSRAKGLSSLLKNIELVDKVRIVTEERRITVIAK